jgi:hypothetical protein
VYALLAAYLIACSLILSVKAFEVGSPQMKTLVREIL